MSTSTPSSPVKKLPERSEVAREDCWDLSSLFSSDAEWEAAYSELESKVDTFESFRGRLGESADQLLEG